MKLNKNDCQTSIVRLEVFLLIKYQIIKKNGICVFNALQHSNKGSNLFLSTGVFVLTSFSFCTFVDVDKSFYDIQWSRIKGLELIELRQR